MPQGRPAKALLQQINQRIAGVSAVARKLSKDHDVPSHECNLLAPIPFDLLSTTGVNSFPADVLQLFAPPLFPGVAHVQPLRRTKSQDAMRHVYDEMCKDDEALIDDGPQTREIFAGAHVEEWRPPIPSASRQRAGANGASC
jgi:hypothetical protein